MPYQSASAVSDYGLSDLHPDAQYLHLIGRMLLDGPRSCTNCALIKSTCSYSICGALQQNPGALGPFAETQSEVVLHKGNPSGETIGALKSNLQLSTKSGYGCSTLG